MKFLEKYICSLSENVSVIRSQKSQSVYIILDNGFKIRLSDHNSVYPCCYGSIKMDIISIFKSKDFLFFMSDSHIPMVKNREDLKAHIRVSYENWAMAQMKIDSDLNCDAHKRLKLKDCRTEDDFSNFITEPRLYDSDLFSSQLCSIKWGKHIPTDVRRYMTGLVKERKITAAKLLYLVREYNSPIHDLNDVHKLLKGIVEFE